ncbi:MAG: SET domain-containing protein-lysine N-methyltransferase [Oligoflexus sp.]
MHLSEKNLDFHGIPLVDPQNLEVRDGKIGQSLFWVGAEIPAGRRIVPFSGHIVRFDDIPEEMIRYVVRYDMHHYIVPASIAMYANHSCDPNCLINDEFCIENIKPLKPGDEITISYDQVSREDLQKWGDFWDPRWSFACSCGAKNCVKYLAGYRMLSSS